MHNTKERFSHTEPQRTYSTSYSKDFLAQHKGDIILHRAAKKAFNEFGVQKLPTIQSIQNEYTQLVTDKKRMYARYRKMRDDMRELLTVKENLERILREEEQRRSPRSSGTRDDFFGH